MGASPSNRSANDTDIRDMNMTEQPRVSSFQPEKGRPTVIDINRPVKFRITFMKGTYVEGTIPPNGGFTVCDHGDIAHFSIIIDDDSVRELGLAPSSPEGPKVNPESQGTD